MKPTNAKSDGCKPVSSNCVIWQGPDIACLKLCKGDSVSDTVNKLATELCNILDQLDVSVYNLPTECFPNQTCDPKDFSALLQLIIDKVCQANDDIEDLRQAAGEGLNCPDCTVDIAECFYYINELGDQVDTMQLVDYVNLIGNTICGISNQILTITQTLSDHETRIDSLENAPPPSLSLPQITPTCVTSSGVPADMNVVLSALEAQFCQLIQTTGSPNSIYQSITKQCQGLNNEDVLSPSGGKMVSIPGWVSTANNLASSINNMWLTICDMRAAVNYIQTNCCPTGCDGIEIKLQATVVGNLLTFYITGDIPNTHEECNALGSSFTVTDGNGNVSKFRVPVVDYVNDASGYTLDLTTTALNPGADMEIDLDVCLEEIATGTRCEFCLKYIVSGQADCPPVTIIANTETEVTVNFTPVVVPATYTIEVWDGSLTTLVQSQSVSVTTSNSVNLTLSGLTPGINYNLRLVITVADQDTNCEFQIFTGLPVVCLAPSNVVPAIATPIECPDCGEPVEFLSNIGLPTPPDVWDEGDLFIVDDAPYLKSWDEAGGAPYALYWYDQQDTAVDITAAPILANASAVMLQTGPKTFAVNDEASPLYGKHFVTTSYGFIVYDNRGHFQTIERAGGCDIVQFVYSPETPNRIYFLLAYNSPTGVYWLDFDPVLDTFPAVIDITKRITTLAFGSSAANRTGSSAQLYMTYEPINKRMWVTISNRVLYMIDMDPLSSTYHQQLGDIHFGNTGLGNQATNVLNTHLTGLGGTPTGTDWAFGEGTALHCDKTGNVWVPAINVSNTAKNVTTDPEGYADIIVLDGSYAYSGDAVNAGFIIGTMDLGQDMNVISSGDETLLDNSMFKNSRNLLVTYPGDGTANSERVLFHGAINTTGGTAGAVPPLTVGTGELYAYDDAGTAYGQWNLQNLTADENTIHVGGMYHPLSNKILINDTKAAKHELYEPDGTYIEDVTLNGNVFITAGNIVFDKANDQFISVSGLGAGNLYEWTYISITDNSVNCTAELVNYFDGTQGPYYWNASANLWQPIATIAAVFDTPAVGQFTVSATLASNVTQAALMYSDDGGITWNTLAGNDGLTYDNPANWAVGRVYSNPASAFTVKLTFTTDESCGRESASISTP